MMITVQLHFTSRLLSALAVNLAQQPKAEREVTFIHIWGGRESMVLH